MGDPPTIVGPYRIIRKLGEGGMGSVFEALHEAIERRVAIKILLPEFAQNQEILARFFNEARAVNRIGHPSLVQINDLGYLPQGTAYLVMELLDGETLSKRLRRSDGNLALGEALLLSSQVTEALAAAHAKAIIHRDLKPDNIMIVVDPVAPNGERIKILDFGIAKLVEEGGSAAKKTRSNVVMGTPSYMSPEQCKGARQVDAKSDVYSFGVMLYQMLSGRLPFDAEGPGEVMVMHIRDAHPPLAQVAPELPREVTSLCDGLLAKDPAARIPMAELAERLTALAEKYRGERKGSAHRAPPSSPTPIAEALTLHTRASTMGQAAVQLGGVRARRLRYLALAPVALIGLLGGGLLYRGSPDSRGRQSAAPPRDVKPTAPPAEVVAEAARAGVPAPTPPPRAQEQPDPRPDPRLAAERSPPPAAKPSSRYKLTSEPGGATVLRASDGFRLGNTPVELDLNEESSPLTLHVRMPGYVEQTFSIRRSEGTSRHVRLVRPRREPAAARAPAPNLRNSSGEKSIFDRIN